MTNTRNEEHIRGTHLARTMGTMDHSRIAYSSKQSTNIKIIHKTRRHLLAIGSFAQSVAKKPAVHELDHSGMPFFIRRDETFTGRPFGLAAQNNCVFRVQTTILIVAPREVNPRNRKHVGRGRKDVAERTPPRARERVGCNGRQDIFKARGYSGLHGGVVSRDFTRKPARREKIIIALTRQFMMPRDTTYN